MISFVAEKDQRIYEIIKTLFHAAQPITITSLADITNASIRSIKYDLNDLKEILKGRQAISYLLDFPFNCSAI